MLRLQIQSHYGLFAERVGLKDPCESLPGQNSLWFSDIIRAVREARCYGLIGCKSLSSDVGDHHIEY